VREAGRLAAPARPKVADAARLGKPPPRGWKPRAGTRRHGPQRTAGPAAAPLGRFVRRRPAARCRGRRA